MLMTPSNKVGLIRPSAIRKMLELSATKGNVVHLEQGEPNFTTPEHILTAASEAMKKGFTHYTEISGTVELRQAIAEKLERDNDIQADPRTEVTVTSGSQEAMFDAALGLLNMGDEALVIDPYYPAYFEDTLLAEAVPITVPLNAENDYKIEAQALESKITSRTKMIWICNPSNPTGHVFTRQDLEILADVAKKHDLIVFSDEIYEKLIYEDAKSVSIASFPGMQDRTVTVNGFSKAYAMTGWRIGYMVAEKKLTAALSTLHYYTTLCANIISQKAALAALNGPQRCVQDMLAEYRKRRELIMNEVKRLDDVSCSRPKGAFYIFPDFSRIKESDEKLAIEILEKAGVVMVPGSGFGTAGKGHLRISYSAEQEQIREGMNRIRSYLESRT
jgi:aspartate/methionine/tyrosine aminotransferase